MPSSRTFLFLFGPNIFVVLTITAFVAKIIQAARKPRVPYLFWVELIAVTLLLPQLHFIWEEQYVAYLPHPLISRSRLSLYDFIAIGLLPSLLALPGALVYRRLPGYIMSLAGFIHLFLFWAAFRFYWQFIA
jgi:hypothetical protein